MFIYLCCAAAAVVGLVGGVALVRQSPFWAAGLLIGGIAAVSYALAMTGSATAFKLYYAFGASMFPGWIGAGSLYAIFSRRVARWPGGFVLLLSAVQLALTLPAAVSLPALAQLGGGNGAGVLLMGPWVIPTVLFNTFGLGFASVAAFFAWWKAFRQPAGKHAALAIGLSLVVIGVLFRADASYKMLASIGGGSAFLLLDAAAFALVWLGAVVTRKLPGFLERLLLGNFEQEGAMKAPNYAAGPSKGA